MTTRREHIIDAIKTALAGTTSVGSRIYRSRTTAITRENSPCLLIEATSETAEQKASVAALDFTVDVTISIITRGDVPDELADPIDESLHARLVSDVTLGGYAMDIVRSGTSWEKFDADQAGGVSTCSYSIRYRTAINDLTTA